jgi:hypothetical protein
MVSSLSLWLVLSAFFVLALRIVERKQLATLLSLPPVQQSLASGLIFVFLGVSIGMLSGLSQSPVVTSLITAVFSIAGAAIAFLYQSGKNAYLVLTTLSSLNISLVFGVISGMILRTVI